MAGHGKTVAGQALLEPGDVGQRGGLEDLLLAGDLLQVGPGNQPGRGQLAPGKLRPRVLLARRCDVAVAQDVVGLDLVAGGDVAHQLDHALGLRGGVGLVPSERVVEETAVDDLDADGTGVQGRHAPPTAHSGMVGTPAFIDQPVDGGWIDVHQVVAADGPFGEDLQRTLEHPGGVVQHDELHPALLADGGVAGVDAAAAGAGRQQGGQQQGGAGAHAPHQEKGRPAGRPVPSSGNWRVGACALF